MRNIRVEYHGSQVAYYNTEVERNGLTLHGIDWDGKRVKRVIYENGRTGCEYVRWGTYYWNVHDVIDELDKAWVYTCDTPEECVQYVRDTLGSTDDSYDVEGIAKTVFWHDGERYCLLDQYRSTTGLVEHVYQVVLDRFCWDTTYELSFTRGELADMAPGLKPEEYDELARYLIKNWKDNMQQDVDALNW